MSKKPSGFRSLALIFLSAAIVWPSVSAAQQGKEIRIATQPGIGYLPLIVMRELKLLEKKIPGLGTEWKELSSGVDVRYAMDTGELDIGSGGQAPFILFADKGLDWKIIGALSEMPLFLNCGSPQIKSLKDVKPSDRIGLPALTSIQHIVMQMEAEKELGNAKAMDSLISPMSHPEATAALLGKKIACHLSSPPFQYEQLKDPGIHKLFDSFQASGGPHTFTLVWASTSWAKAQPELFRSFSEALKEAVEFINEKPQEAALLYARSVKTKLSADEVLKIMQSPGIKYTRAPRGLMRFAAFMQKIELIKKTPSSWKDYAFDSLHSLKGS